LSEPRELGRGHAEELARTEKIFRVDHTYNLNAALVMNAEAATALAKVTENQFATPAREDTKRTAWRALVLVISCATIAYQPHVAPEVAAMVAAVLGGVPIVEKLLSRKKDRDGKE
jgi:hypothetical protein